MKDDELEVVKGKIKLLEDELDENDTRDIDEKQTVSANIVTKNNDIKKNGQSDNTYQKVC